MGLGHVFGNNRHQNNKPDMWAWNGLLALGVGMGLGSVIGNKSSSRNNKPVMWGWDGIMIVLELVWVWALCHV